MSLQQNRLNNMADNGIKDSKKKSSERSGKSKITTARTTKRTHDAAALF